MTTSMLQRLDREALGLFWRVYDANHAAVTRQVREEAVEDPRFAAAMTGMDPGRAALDESRGYELARAALMQSEWAPYLDHLRSQGATFARVGLAFSAWYTAATLFRAAMRPLLVGAYGDDVDRLVRAIAGLNSYVDVAMATIGESYIEEKERIIRAQKGELAEALQRGGAGRLFRALLESAPDAFVVVDAGGRIVVVNAQTERLFGYTREELVGEPVEILVPHQLRGGHVEHRGAYMGEARLRPMGQGLDLLAVRKDGSEFPVEISLSPIEGDEGLLVISALRDVTARREAEERLRASERQLARAQRVAQLGTWEWDVAADRIEWSENMYRIYGLAPDSFDRTVQAFLECVHPDDRAKVREVVDRALRDGGTFSMNERIVRPDGSVRVLESWGDVSLDARGRAARLFGICQDVTERRQVEAELRAARDELEVRVRERTAELERSNAELEQFAYVASHDLQEPLRMVASFVSLLERRWHGRLDEQADQWIGYAVEGSHRMQTLIGGLLSYARAGSAADPIGPVDTSVPLGSAIENVQLAIVESGAHVTWDELPEVLGHAGQLTHLFQNLIANAIKFRGEGPPRVHVSARRDGDLWVFSVSDNGIGIDPADAGRIFQVFQRLHGRDRYPGNGIGLAIAKKIVERHGGRIWFESQPGRGATFSFNLRRAPAGALT